MKSLKNKILQYYTEAKYHVRVQNCHEEVLLIDLKIAKNGPTQPLMFTEQLL